MALGREHGQPRPVPFKRRVGGDGGAVHDAIQTSRLQRQATDADQNSLRLVVGRGRGLEHLQPSARAVQENEVGESPPTSTPNQLMRPILLPSAIAQRPTKRGGRFAAKAAAPSL